MVLQGYNLRLTSYNYGIARLNVLQADVSIRDEFNRKSLRYLSTMVIVSQLS